MKAARHTRDSAPASHPDVIAFAEALARAHVARDLAAARKELDHAHGHLRPL